ncbi:MAG TPA: choice-of-anchor V domain-containing protein [Polyangia bacterium]|nr:choice-of-anchor V domain-containing protein [Polyangia bacterium]
MLRPALLLMMLLPASARAFIGGVSGSSGKSGTTCAGCHAQTGAPPMVTLSGPAALVTGETETYSIDIVTGASTLAVGYDVAASDGTLGTIAQANASQIMNGELTHTSMLAKGKEVRVMFTLTAPAAPGTVTLFAAGLKSDGNDDTAGDSSAVAMLQVTVSAGTATPADLAGVDAISGATPPPAPAKDEPRWACSFGDGAGASLPALVGAALLALAIRRRRAR